MAWLAQSTFRFEGGPKISAILALHDSDSMSLDIVDVKWFTERWVMRTKRREKLANGSL